MSFIEQLLDGYRGYCHDYFRQRTDLSGRLAEGQNPGALVIACSDSRVDPAVMLGADPGDLFVVRNVANIVPPADQDTGGHHGVSAAVEYAVKHLLVDHIIVMGHSQCGGIGALVTGYEGDDPQTYIAGWMSCMTPALERTQAMGFDHPEWTVETQRSVCEREALKVSQENLMTYDWLARRVQAGQLTLHAWHYDIASGNLEGLDEHNRFGTLVDLDSASEGR